MARIDTSIKRPYFGRQNYGRVIDKDFNQLSQTQDSSTKKIQDLVKEYNRLYDSLPADIHKYIAKTCAKALGFNPDQANIDKINELNHILDDLENQLSQDDLIDVQQHPNFANGSFIRGKIITSTGAKSKTGYWFMQRGHRRPIGKLADDVDLFKFLFNVIAKKNPSDPNIDSQVPLLTQDTLVGIPLAKPIIRDEFGAETKFTNIFELPEGYIDVANYYNAVNEQIKRDRYLNNQINPENTAKSTSYFELISTLEARLADNPNDEFLKNRIESLKSIFKNYPPPQQE
jgi:hypothetical protein